MKNKLIFLGLIFSTLTFGSYLGDPVNVKSGGLQTSTAPTSGQVPIGTAGGIYAPQSLSSEATMVASGAVTLSNAAVISKVLTGYSSGAGVVSATDTILQAIQKLNGNQAAAGGTVTSVAASVPAFLSIAGSPVTTSGTLAISLSGTALPVANGGTGQTSYTDGQILIGTTAGNTLTKSTLTQGAGVSITNGSGSITIAGAAPATSALGASNIDWSALKNVDGLYTKTLSANTTLTFSNVLAGQTIVIALTNTASNYTVTWPAAAKFPGGTAPVQTVGAFTDVITCKSYDGTNAYCSSVQNY